MLFYELLQCRVFFFRPEDRSLAAFRLLWLSWWRRLRKAEPFRLWPRFPKSALRKRVKTLILAAGRSFKPLGTLNKG